MTEIHSVPCNNRKPTATVYFIAKILFDHLKTGECDLMKNESKTLTAQSILSSIYVMGGAPRDILLNTDINDIDILVDTQKLNQLHLNHLHKYHSSYKQQLVKSSCIFWRLYLQKFNAENKPNKLHKNQTKRQLPNDSRVKIGYFQTCNQDIDDDDNKDPFPDKITANTRNILDSNYMLNSKYFTDIISKCEELKNFINVTIYAKKKNLFRLNEIEITKDIFYADVNLHGQSIDFLDAVKRNANINIIEKYEKSEFNKLYPHKYHYSDVKYRKCQIKDNFNESDGPIPIAMEIYDVSAMEAILQADLSVNMLWIDLLSVLDCEDFNWYNKIKDCELLSDYNIKEDFKNKMLTHPYLDQTVLIQRPQYHLFRIIKMYVACGDEWSIDINLINVSKKYFYLWLEDEEFWCDENENGYMFILWNLFDRDRYSPSNAKELYLVLKGFEMFGINKILVTKLQEIEGFRYGFLQSLKNLVNAEKNSMIELYGNYRYPIAEDH